MQYCLYEKTKGNSSVIVADHNNTEFFDKKHTSYYRQLCITKTWEDLRRCFPNIAKVKQHLGTSSSNKFRELSNVKILEAKFPMFLIDLRLKRNRRCCKNVFI